ncbi:ferredoxin [Methanocalculus sp.]|uniref:ferredoxin n=1 Tax=Methanocalculus sp. TaxID=2004547 RepID=UPI00271604CA|nr:ferredoxin [Methanocalculus sp.]MDO8842637.1 ferredoxin [Methanocalculus sp.]
MKVSIDRMACISCGSCWDTCPDFFEQNPDDSFSQIIEEFRQNGMIAEGESPQDQNDCILDAADLCPVQIISVD